MKTDLCVTLANISIFFSRKDDTITDDEILYRWRRTVDTNTHSTITHRALDGRVEMKTGIYKNDRREPISAHPNILRAITAAVFPFPSAGPSPGVDVDDDGRRMSPDLCACPHYSACL
jgi:hypothetical protein